MDQQTNNPIITIFLFIGTVFGVSSIQDVNDILAVILKSVSIVSFLVATCYALWKWRSEYKKSKP